MELTKEIVGYILIAFVCLSIVTALVYIMGFWKAMLLVFVSILLTAMLIVGVILTSQKK